MANMSRPMSFRDLQPSLRYCVNVQMGIRQNLLAICVEVKVGVLGPISWICTFPTGRRPTLLALPRP